MKSIVIASNNQGKIKEIKEILASKSFEFLSLKEAGFDSDMVEDQDSFEGNALKKATTVVKVVNQMTLADDSGLEVDALHGQPGILSARFAGDGATDLANNSKLLEIMKDIPIEQRGAQFRCVMVLILPNGKTYSAEGVCRGIIADKAYGNKGFGYDPLFIPEGYTRTFGQIDEDEKNKISHRFIALQKLKAIMIKEDLFD